MKFRLLLIVSAFSALVFQIISCQQKPVSVALDITKSAAEKLSDYGFFTGALNELRPNEQVIPYDLITPLFSDYAHKARFVFVPKGKAAEYDTSRVLQLPVGSCLIKSFYYPEDFNKPEGKRRIIETRLLVHRENGWDNLDYIWNEDQTEAFLDNTGGVKHVSWVHYDGRKRELDYVIPNKNQCKGCHWRNDQSFSPIGPKVRNLNHDFAYASGKENQLMHWQKAGILKGMPRNSPRIADWTDSVRYSVNDRARAYLEMNCGHCHNPKGPAYTSGLHLNLENQTAENLGICKSPVAAGKATGGFSCDIVPGDPDHSILVYRMESDDPGVKMPEVGRVLVHKEGVALIRQWIAGMPVSDCTVK